MRRFAATAVPVVLVAAWLLVAPSPTEVTPTPRAGPAPDRTTTAAPRRDRGRGRRHAVPDPAADARTVAVSGVVRTVGGLPVGGLPLRLDAGTDAGSAADARTGVTSADGRFELTVGTPIHTTRIVLDFADHTVTRHFERDPAHASAPWVLPAIFIASARSIVLVLETGPTVLDRLRTAGSTVQVRVRHSGGARTPLLAVDHRGDGIRTALRHTVWLAAPGAVWIGVGIREPFAAVTSWFHRSELEPSTPEHVVRIALRDAMVIAGRVVDEFGHAVPEVAVEFAVAAPSPRLMRARTGPDGRFVLIPPGDGRGSLCAKLGSRRGPSVEAGPGDRPELRIDRGDLVRVRVVRGGAPVREPFFLATWRPSRRADPERSGLSDHRSPHEDGVAFLAVERLEAGDRLFFESESDGERMLTVRFPVAAPGRVTDLELAGSVGCATLDLDLPAGSVIGERSTRLSLHEVLDPDARVEERQRVRYAIDVPADRVSIPGLLRLPYRFALEAGDGTRTTGRLDLQTAGPCTLIVDGDGNSRLVPGSSDR